MNPTAMASNLIAPGESGIDVNLSNMDVYADLESLQLFNEKAEELRQSTFAERAFSPGTGITISMGVDKPLQVERRGPDDENLRAFVLTLRFFVQNNEQPAISRRVFYLDQYLQLQRSV